MRNARLSRYFRTYYLGYETAYSEGVKHPIFIERGRNLGLSVRKSVLSEMWAPRFVYNLLVVGRISDLDKATLLEKVAQINPEVIIANSIQDINLLRFFRRNGLVFKAVYIDHGSVSTSISGYFSKEGIPLTIGTGLNSLSVSHKKGKFFNFYDVNIALNHSQLSAMCNFTDKVALIQNGLDISSNKNLPRIRSLRKGFGIKATDFVVLYMGRMFDRQKNVSTLIRAFRGIGGKNLKLLLVGDGPSLRDYKRLAHGDSRIIFGGSARDEDISSIYNLSSLFALPSFWEGFSLTILEAAAHSLPMILSKNAYVDDLKGNGIGEMASFNPSSAKEIRDCIIALYSNKAKRARAVRASIKIRKTFTENRMIEKYRNLLKRLA